MKAGRIVLLVFGIIIVLIGLGATINKRTVVRDGVVRSAGQSCAHQAIDHWFRRADDRQRRKVSGHTSPDWGRRLHRG